jgi:hypothetical protein
MLFFKIFLFLGASLVCHLIFAENVWAWGPAIHTVIGCKILEQITLILPAVAGVIRSFPLEYLYGSLAADFFVGKGQRKRDGHPHNWETGFQFLNGAGEDREVAYGLGFLSHLAADVVAHNYFVPNLIHSVSTWKRMGHIYWEAKADHFVGPLYMKIAKGVLSMEALDCDHLLKSAVGRGRNGFKTRKHLFTQTVKISDLFNGAQPMYFASRGSRYGPRYQISEDYLISMIDLAYRLVRDFLKNPGSSPCLSFDPIGSRNLRLASRNGVLSKIFHTARPMYQFTVDEELLTL